MDLCGLCTCAPHGVLNPNSPPVPFLVDVGKIVGYLGRYMRLQVRPIYSWQLKGPILIICFMLPPALMEYHVCKATNVATRIFEKGIELFGNEEIEIVLRYLGFLISLNDDASELLFQL
jgi:hypothetical protein